MYTVKCWPAYETEKETLLHAKKVKRRSQLPVLVKKKRNNLCKCCKSEKSFFCVSEVINK